MGLCCDREGEELASRLCPPWSSNEEWRCGRAKKTRQKGAIPHGPLYYRGTRELGGVRGNFRQRESPNICVADRIWCGVQRTSERCSNNMRNLNRRCSFVKHFAGSNAR